MAIKTPETRKEQDSQYNPGDIHAAEQFGSGYASSGADQAEAYANDSANTTKSEEETPNEIPHEEESQAPSKNGRFNLSLGGAKKKGPILSIILLVLGIGLGGSTLFGPALLIVQMKEVFSNYGGSASRAAPLRYQQRLVYMIGNDKVEKACSNNPASRRCKAGTMSEKDRRNYEKNGFKFNKAEDVNGRTIIREVEFPDGKKVKSGKDFNNYVKKNPGMASRALGAHNPRTLIFNGGRFSKVVLKKFGLDKSKLRLAGDDDKERKKSFNTRAGADSDESDSDRKNKLESKHGDKIKKAGKIRGKGLGAVAGVACAAYNVSRVTVATVKLENSLRFAGFAMLFLKAADQIKDQGSVDPGTIATLGGILTSYATSGPKKGLTATDAQGYKIAAYGGEGALAKFSQSYLLGGSPTLKTLDDTNRKVKDLFTINGYNSMRTGCKAISNIALGTAVGAAVCAAGGGGGGALAGSIVPVAGTAVGAIAGTATCLLGSLALSFTLSWAAGKIIALALPYIIDAIKDAPIDADIGGVDAGNAIAAGSGALLSTTSLSRGMKPADKGDVAAFKTATAENERQYEDIARYDARDEPFNVYNEYSFLGSLVRSSGITYSPNTSIVTSLRNIGTLMSSAIRVTPSTLALANMPLPITDEDLSHCPDEDLKDIGVDCDRMGQMQLTMSNTELQMSLEDNLTYMIGEYVDESGAVLDEESDYGKFVQYCTEQREYLMGSDGLPIEESDDWTSGKNCTVNNKMLNNFRVYYFDQGDVEDSDYNTGEMASLGAGSQLRVASYNVLGASHTDKNPGEDGYSPLPDWDERIVKVKDNIITNNIDVIGFQEFEDKQRKYIKDNIAGYEMSSHGKDSDSILWNANRFTKVDQGTWQTVYFGAKKIDEPWVKLRDISSGQEFYFMSLHDPVNNTGTNATTRYENAKKHLATIQGLQQQAPVIIVGDFNNGYRKSDGSGMPSDEKTAYCILSNGGMTDAQDAVKDQNFKCSGNPRPDKGSDISSNIDHIYISQGLDVSKYFDIDKPQSGSDHVAVIADVVIPSKDSGEDGGGTLSGDLSWPLAKKYWDDHKSAWLKGHIGTGTAWGGDNMGTSSKGAGIASDLGVNSLGMRIGTNVYAIASGTVTSVNLCGSGDGIAIKSNVNGKTLGIAYMHGTSQQFKVGDTVKAGQYIMNVGEIGCNVDGAHLHVGIAYGGKYVCPQDVWLALDKKETVNWATLAGKGVAPCSRL